MVFLTQCGLPFKCIVSRKLEGTTVYTVPTCVASVDYLRSHNRGEQESLNTENTQNSSTTNNQKCMVMSYSSKT